MTRKNDRVSGKVGVRETCLKLKCRQLLHDKMALVAMTDKT